MGIRFCYLFVQENTTYIIYNAKLNVWIYNHSKLMHTASTKASRVNALTLIVDEGFGRERVQEETASTVSRNG